MESDERAQQRLDALVARCLAPEDQELGWALASERGWQLPEQQLVELAVVHMAGEVSFLLRERSRRWIASLDLKQKAQDAATGDGEAEDDLLGLAVVTHVSLVLLGEHGESQEVHPEVVSHVRLDEASQVFSFRENFLQGSSRGWRMDIRYLSGRPLFFATELRRLFGLDVREEIVVTPSASRERTEPNPALIRRPQDAERAVREWMKYFGFEDAELTPGGPDSGVDVMSSAAVAQVKAYMVPVGRPDIQRLAGVAGHARKRGLFFALNGYTSEAAAWADEAEIALFSFDFQGRPVAENRHARRVADLER